MQNIRQNFAAIGGFLQAFCVQLCVCAFFTLFFGGLAFFAQPNVQASSNIFISEINFAGSVSSNNCKTVSAANRCAYDKWLELTNPTSQPILLNQYSLQFRNSTDSRDIFTFPDGVTIQGGGFLVVGYTEVNFDSVLVQWGQPAVLQTSKILRMSNNETQTVQVALINPLGNKIDDINWEGGQVSEFLSNFLPESKHSVFYQNGNWSVSQSAFFGLNFGSPGFSSANFIPTQNAEVNEVLMPVVSNAPKQVSVSSLPARVVAAQPQPAFVPVTALKSSTSVQSVALNSARARSPVSTIAVHYVPLPSHISGFLARTAQVAFISHHILSSGGAIFSMISLACFVAVCQKLLRITYTANVPPIGSITIQNLVQNI